MGAGSAERRPGPRRAVWISWSVTLGAGLLVVIAAGMVLADPCREGGPCVAARGSRAALLAIGATVTALAATLVATVLTVRHRAR